MKSAWQDVEPKLKIGVLALQGGFALHLSCLSNLGVEAVAVRYPHELEACSGLILPGGESTTMTSLLHESGLFHALQHFNKPLFGTCAGMILLSKLGLLSVAIERNAWGRQCESFSAQLQVAFPTGIKMCEGIFIRAPRIKAILSNEVQVLASHLGEPVFVQQGRSFGATFHPELTEESDFHRFYVGVCYEFARENSRCKCS